MSAAWSAASRALSLWSDALIQRVMPAAATSTNRTAAHLRNMGHSSENGRTGAERHPLYARPAHSDCWPLLVCRHLPDEERRLGGLGRATRGLLRDRGKLERETGRHVQSGGQAAIARGIEHTEAHRLSLGNGPQLVRAAGGRGRQVEDCHDHAVPRWIPIEPGGGRLSRGGERRRGDIRREDRRDERITRGKLVALGSQGRVGTPQGTARAQEHTSELQSHGLISYAVFCLKKKKTILRRSESRRIDTKENYTQ